MECSTVVQHSAQLSKEVPFSDMKNYPEPSFDDPDFGLALELTLRPCDLFMNPAANPLRNPVGFTSGRVVVVDSIKGQTAGS